MHRNEILLSIRNLLVVLLPADVMSVLMFKDIEVKEGDKRKQMSSVV